MEDEKSAKRQKIEDQNEIVLKYFRLKSIIKENHGKAIQQIVFNKADTRYNNLVATIGDTQSNIYDNEHFGPHLDLFLHFDNKETPYTKGSRTLRSCCWIRAGSKEGELKDDCYLALGGDDHLIHIISIKRMKTIHVLTGHKEPVVCLASNPLYPHLLLSGSKDTVILWDIHKLEPQLTKQEISCSSITFHPDGNSFVTGSSNGSVTWWTLNSSLEKIQSSKVVKMQEKKGHSAAVDCVQFDKANRLISKSTDGKIFVWNILSGTVDVELKVPNSQKQRSLFDITEDASHLVVGNAEGTVYLYNLVTGKQISRLEHKRSKSVVPAAVFSCDKKSILFASDTHIWRFDSVPTDPSQEQPNNS